MAFRCVTLAALACLLQALVEASADFAQRAWVSVWAIQDDGMAGRAPEVLEDEFTIGRVRDDRQALPLCLEVVSEIHPWSKSAVCVQYPDGRRSTRWTTWKQYTCTVVWKRSIAIEQQKGEEKNHGPRNTRGGGSAGRRGIGHGRRSLRRRMQKNVKWRGIEG